MKKQCRRLCSSRPQQPYFPEEIVFDILVRLPVKSLLRFKAVCKSWRALISDKKFAKSHLDMTNKRISVGVDVLHNLIDPERYGVFCSNLNPSNTLNFISLTDGGDCTSVEMVSKSDHPSFRDVRHLLGSCNGLVLFSCVLSNELFLCNPSTGEYNKKILPINKKDRRRHAQMSGLGYDSSLDEYKAIIIFGTGDSIRQAPEKVLIVSFNGGGVGGTTCTSVTKYFPGFPYFVRWPILPAVTVNGGALHWVVTRKTNTDSKAIVYFDMADENFKEVPPPDSLSHPSIDESELVDLGGCLCVVVGMKMSSFELQEFDVWAMKEYGVKESWTKLFVIRSSACVSMQPLVFTNSGEVLIQPNTRELVSYNLQTGKQEVKFSSGKNSFSCVSRYVASLV